MAPADDASATISIRIVARRGGSRRNSTLRSYSDADPAAAIAHCSRFWTPASSSTPPTSHLQQFALYVAKINTILVGKLSGTPGEAH